MTKRSRVRVSVAAALLAAVALVAAGAVAALLLLPGPAAGTPEVQVGGSAVRVTTEPFDGARQVSVTATVVPSKTLTTTETGRVTASACSAGREVRSGDVLLTVDDRPLLALATDVPLWRDLGSGAQGEDVRAVQTELVRLGHDLVPDGDYGPATRAVVREIQEAVGVVRPDGYLAAAAVVWLPHPAVTVSECLLGVGDPTGDGQVATVAGGLTALTVVEPPGEGWVVRLDGTTGAVDADGIVRDAELLAVAAQSEPYLLSQEDGTNRFTVELALAQEVDVAVLPPSAVVATGDGRGCVRSADGDSRTVEVVASSLGQTMVTFVGGPPPPSVLVRPDDRTTC
ncbi:peptidoglycan-binding domain-containing protein [Isoptericola dokdonensis]|uniref:Putative peptidoglycan binding domain protein n=1 Tax=Isoptericola dokdonensis DS-3 TaxID=1300344 RepID=A0A161I3E1_9MICO|nr:peptidoglycan-binding domain-containing protein [Isoptericola dokdonensis]ANC32535.1 Putative peptidoglycan binding domain protein [Isoptericola dokdonensis DS-3]